MTTSPNEMSDEELYQSITDICFENGGVTKPMADKLLKFIKQHREAYAVEARLDELSICNDMCVHASLGETYQVEEMIEERIAELREKVGRDDTK